MMSEKNDAPRSQLSVRIPKFLHKRAKMLAIARETDLQEVVTNALQVYLTYSDTQPLTHAAVKTELK